jgi:hypothetical protein
MNSVTSAGLLWFVRAEYAIEIGLGTLLPTLQRD